MRDVLRAGDQEHYFRILARLDLLLPVSADSAGRRSPGWGTWSSDGRTHVLAFTSIHAMRACLAEHAGNYRLAQFRELAEQWPNPEWWLAINPGLPVEGYLPAWFVAQISRGDVRLPGRTMGSRARMEHANTLRARAVAQVPRRMPPASPVPAGGGRVPPGRRPPGAGVVLSGEIVESSPVDEPVSPAAPGPIRPPVSPAAPGPARPAAQPAAPGPARPVAQPAARTVSPGIPGATIGGSGAPLRQPGVPPGRERPAEPFPSSPGPAPGAVPMGVPPAAAADRGMPMPLTPTSSGPPRAPGTDSNGRPDGSPASPPPERPSRASRFDRSTYRAFERPDVRDRPVSPTHDRPGTFAPTGQSDRAGQGERPGTFAQPGQGDRPSQFERPGQSGDRAGQFERPGQGGDRAGQFERPGERTGPGDAVRPGASDRPDFGRQAPADPGHPAPFERPGSAPAARSGRSDLPTRPVSPSGLPMRPVSQPGPDPFAQPDFRDRPASADRPAAFADGGRPMPPPDRAQPPAHTVQPPDRAQPPGHPSQPPGHTGQPPGHTVQQPGYPPSQPARPPGEPSYPAARPDRGLDHGYPPPRPDLPREADDTPPWPAGGKPVMQPPPTRFGPDESAVPPAAALSGFGAPSPMGASPSAFVPPAAFAPPDFAGAAASAEFAAAGHAAGPPGPAASGFTSRDPAPAEPAPVHFAPAEPVPAHPAPADRAPADPAPGYPGAAGYASAGYAADVTSGYAAAGYVDGEAVPGHSTPLTGGAYEPSGAPPVGAPFTTPAPQVGAPSTGSGDADSSLGLGARLAALQAQSGGFSVIPVDEPDDAPVSERPATRGMWDPKVPGTPVDPDDDPSPYQDPVDEPFEAADLERVSPTSEPEPEPEPEPIDFGAYPPANDTERELLEAARNGSSDRVLSTLLLAKVLIPGYTADASQWPIEEISGGRYLVAFTSKERLAARSEAEQPEPPTLRFTSVIARWPSDDIGFALNPGTPMGKLLGGSEVRGLARSAAEFGLIDDADESESTQLVAPPQPAARPAHTSPPAGQPQLMQRTISAAQVSMYLERGYDRVCGFVHRASELSHLSKPIELYRALGLLYPGSPFRADDADVYVLRWPAHPLGLYRIPFGGQSEEAMHAMQGWMIERPPFRGNGFAPSESSDVVAEFKIDSTRLPHGTQLWRLNSEGIETLIALFDADGTRWRRIGASDA